MGGLSVVDLAHPRFWAEAKILMEDRFRKLRIAGGPVRQAKQPRDILYFLAGLGLSLLMNQRGGLDLRQLALEFMGDCPRKQMGRTIDIISKLLVYMPDPAAKNTELTDRVLSEIGCSYSASLAALPCNTRSSSPETVPAP